jgi:amino acid transporter
MITGTALVTGIYLLVNAGFLRALGFSGLAATETPAADAVGALLPGGDRFVAALVCVSALGAVNGLIFAGARISYALGSDYAAFRALGRWDPVTGTPIVALSVQAAIALGLIVIVGSFVDTILYTAAAVYGFYLATSVAVLVLRRREPLRTRPFKVPGYPWPVLIFAATCVLLIHGAFVYKPWLSTAAWALILLGLPLERIARGKPERA